VPQAPSDIAAHSCACKDACSSRRCLCRRWGGRCKESCKCQGLYCGNKFLTNGLYFGEAHRNLRATHCFADYVEKAETLDNRRPHHDNDADISVSNLKSLLLADHNYFDKSDELREWRDKLYKTGPDFEDHLIHLRWLFRLGLSISESDPRFYSFCLKEWTDQNTHRHCAVCKRCCPVKTSWHCSVCRQCRHDGLYVACYRCGGKSSAAMSEKEKEIEFWRSERIETPSDLFEAAGPSVRAFDDDLSLSGIDVRTSIEIRNDASNPGPAVP